VDHAEVSDVIIQDQLVPVVLLVPSIHQFPLDELSSLKSP
jgi:hypothetical protein